MTPRARLAVELLTTPSAQRATDLARWLEQQNIQRQSVERRIYSEARDLSERQEYASAPALVTKNGDGSPDVLNPGDSWTYTCSVTTQLGQDGRLARVVDVALLARGVENSATDLLTRLLSRLGDAYADVLEDHRRALREAFTQHGGVEVDTQGDAFFVAFPRAKDALAAAA